MIGIGIKGVDSLQPEAKDMSPAYLAERFGGRLNFRGLISTTGALSFGTPEDVTELCGNTLDVMMKYGRYHFAPSHAIQDNTPVENVIAMYQAAHDFGRYK
jgi:uroporphyrinogen decarboxylase